MSYRVIVQQWQDYKRHFRFWRLAIGKAAIKNTIISDDGNCWEIWFNVGDVGIWWRRY